MASLIAQLVKNLPAMQETPVQFLGAGQLNHCATSEESLCAATKTQHGQNKPQKAGDLDYPVVLAFQVTLLRFLAPVWLQLG